ncbi:RagB/SusD family nutrient uptake outer membrane protein [Olivibacter jilunii]|uniref:RagB/SusD family nutrient uptake outer membrane protein n=1 Tax=Olivibacter jilunii TaxID=985016 RepID=UPI003F15541E
MKKIIFPINIIAILAVMVIASSCSKDWLNPDPENIASSEDSTYADPANAGRFVTAAYTNLLTWEQSSFAWIGTTSITSDDADKGSSPGDLGTDKDQLDNFTFTATTPSFRDGWNSNFLGISYCNQALANVPVFDIDEALKTRYFAEVRFLRAFYYFNLVRMYGNVPKLDKVVTNEDVQSPDLFRQLPPDSIYAFIKSDLEFALKTLPKNTEYGPENVGRATQGAAAALLAKVSMYRKEWDRAYSLTDSIINGAVGSYALVSDYTTIWREVGENSSESLFEIQSTGQENGSVRQYSQVQGIKEGQFNVPSSQVFQGWGFNTPSADLYNAYSEGDVRRDATIISVGNTLFDGVVVRSAFNPRYNYKAYVSIRQETQGGSTDFSNKNIRILRMGEIYLIRAEAANELGMSAEALNSLNAIRTRARGDNPNAVPNITVTDQAQLRQLIWNERRLELAMEHDRFFDLVRTGRAGEVLRAHGKNFVDGKHELFPIPQDEIAASGGVLVQNPGY